MIEETKILNIFKIEFKKVCDFVISNMEFKKSKSLDENFYIKNTFYVNVVFNIQNNIDFQKINKIRTDLVEKVGYYNYIESEKEILEEYYNKLCNNQRISKNKIM